MADHPRLYGPDGLANQGGPSPKPLAEMQENLKAQDWSDDDECHEDEIERSRLERKAERDFAQHGGDAWNEEDHGEEDAVERRKRQDTQTAKDVREAAVILGLIRAFIAARDLATFKIAQRQDRAMARKPDEGPVREGPTPGEAKHNGRVKAWGLAR